MSSAAFAYPQKSAEAFRTISEVAIELDVPQHVLRFWESRFPQVRPVKRAGGRRYYRPEDIDLLKGIRALLHGDGLTIRGVQKVLKERGHRHVAELGRGEVRAPQPQVQVIEKIVYIEKPVPAAKPAPKKPRGAHLRAVPDTLDLPFFDEPAPSREFPTLDAAPRPAVEPAIEPIGEPAITEPEMLPEPVVAAPLEDVADDGLAAADRERLEELLAELLGLKKRLQAAREAIRN